MHFSKSVISLFIFFLLSNAAPVERIEDSVVSRSLDEQDALLEQRAKIAPGPFQGARYQPVPNHHIYKTETNTYTGKEVNAAARNSLLHAAKGTGTHPGYPKEGSGWSKSNPGDPTGPNKPGKAALHSPIINHTTDHSHSPKNHPNPPGPDRVVVWKGPKDSKFQAHVSYHDSKKPMTGAQANHPFSAAKVKIPRGKKGKQIGQGKPAKPPRPAQHKPAAPSKSKQKKAAAAKHNVKKAQKFGGKRPQKPSKAAQQKAQRKANHAKNNHGKGKRK